uniref:Uncharacterized protein n=1 Tax=Arundo donax TaxID=35708 RepID=A0A0A9HMJ8_ARUDO
MLPTIQSFFTTRPADVGNLYHPLLWRFCKLGVYVQQHMELGVTEILTVFLRWAAF